MDPVSAIGVAAAVVQFVDFGKRLVRRAHQIYMSPASRTAQENELLLSLRELREVADQAKETFDLYPETRSDLNLAKIHGDVNEAAEELYVILEGLQSRSDPSFSSRNERKGILKAFREGYGSMRTEKQVRQALDRLDSIRRRGYSFTLSALWQASKESTHRELRFAEKLDDMLASLGQIKLEGEVTFTSDNEMCEECKTARIHDELVMSQLNDSGNEDCARIYAELVQRLWNPKPQPIVQSAETGSTGRELQTAIIDSLVSEAFNNIHDRGEAIARSYEGTFHWVFKNEPPVRDGKALWSSFPSWFESKTDLLYWITGKPGSGKSTLMKYILQSPELNLCLSNWAEGYPLHTANFYAWIAGSDLQKSHLGFMTTILYQCLQGDPEMVRSIAPRRWSLLNTLRSAKRQPPWKDWETRGCFDKLLITYGKSGPKRLVIFVDGLDEFKDSPEMTLDLIHDISKRGIKICLASRQWTEFNDTLDKYPMLRIQDLTEEDMMKFVQGSLEANRGFSDLSKAFPIEARLLIQDTVDKSSGVFLWSALVIKKLLQSLSAGDGLPYLRQVLEALPDDLENLFSRLWDSIEGTKSDSAELITLKKAAYPELNYLTLWLADGGGGGIEQELQLSALSDDAKSGLRGTMVRRLDSKTRGLVELSPKGNVEFIHRTAADWVAQEDVWTEISSHLTELFDPYLKLLHAEALRFPESLDESWYQVNGQEKIEDQMHRVLRYAFGVTNSATDGAKTGLIKALDNMDLCVREYAYKTWGSEYEAKWKYRSSNGIGCDFFGLITRYCFIPYLAARFQSAQNTMEKTSTLENAIFGHQLTLRAADAPLDLRLSTVAFLLEKGIAPGQLSDSRRRELRVQVGKDSTLISEEERSYWEDVERLLRAREPQQDRQLMTTRFTRKKEDRAMPANRIDSVSSNRRGRLLCFNCFSAG